MDETILKSDTAKCESCETCTGCEEEQLTAGLPIPESLAAPELFHYYLDLSERIFWINDVIDDGFTYIIQNIVHMNKIDAGTPADERSPIYLLINSVGGDLDMMWSLIDAIQTSKTPVVTICMGYAYSAALMVMLAGHKRYIMPHARIMMHDGSASLDGDFASVGLNYTLWSESVKADRDYIIERTNITADNLDDKLGTIANHMGKDWFIKSKEAVDLHIADSVIDDIEAVFK